MGIPRGYLEKVLSKLKKAEYISADLGARGGTVLRARWSGDKSFAQYGINQQAEKEIIAIVIPNDIRNSIMDQINAQYGMNSKAQAVVLSMKVDHFAPI